MTSKLQTHTPTHKRNSTLSDNKGPLKLSAREPIIQERLELEKLAIERERLKTETGLKTAELQNKQHAENDVTKLLKRYGDALAQFTT